MKAPTKYKRIETLAVEVGPGVGGSDPDKFDFEAAQWQAVLAVHALRASYKMTLPHDARIELARAFYDHPDKAVIKEWFESLSTVGDEHRWDYGSEWIVIYFLAIHVLSEWQDIPKLTKRSHVKLYGDIQQAAGTLRQLLEGTGAKYTRGGGHGLDRALVSDFFTDQEAEKILGPIEFWNESHAESGEDGRPMDVPPWAHFPMVDEILERIASAAIRLQEAGPIHSQPNKRGAMNGYFIRRMDALLRCRYGDYPADVLAVIATIALSVTVDADLVQKTVGLPERSSKKKAPNVRRSKVA